MGSPSALLLGVLSQFVDGLCVQLLGNELPIVRLTLFRVAAQMHVGRMGLHPWTVLAVGIVSVTRPTVVDQHGYHASAHWVNGGGVN